MYYKITDLIEPDNGCEGFCARRGTYGNADTVRRKRQRKKSAAAGYARVSAKVGRRNDSNK